MATTVDKKGMSKKDALADDSQKNSSSSLSLAFYTAIFIDVATIAMIAPLVPQLSKELKISTGTLGMIKSLYGILQTFATPVLGVLTDKVGARAILTLSLLGTSTSYLFIAYATLFTSVTSFFMSRVVSGATRQTLSTASALITDVYAAGLPQGEARRKAASVGLSRISFCCSLAFSIGPMFGGVLAASFGMSGACIAAFALGVANTLMMYFSVPANALKQQTSKLVENSGDQEDKRKKKENDKSSKEKRGNPLYFALSVLFVQRDYTSALLLSITLKSFAGIMAYCGLAQMIAETAKNVNTSSSTSGESEVGSSAIFSALGVKPYHQYSSVGWEPEIYRIAVWLQSIVDNPTALTGFVIGLSSTLGTLSQLCLPFFLKRFTSSSITVASLILTCSGFWIQYNCDGNFFMLCCGIFVSWSTSGISDTINKSAFTDAYKKDESAAPSEKGRGRKEDREKHDKKKATTRREVGTGEVMSVVQSIDGFNRALGPLVWGWIMEKEDRSATFPLVISCFCSLTAALLYLICVYPTLSAESISEKDRKKKQ